MQEKLVAGHDGVGLAVRVHDGPAPDAEADADAAAPGLLLHHGLASSQRIWDLMLPRLRRRFRVVTYDARGHGRSRKPPKGYGFDPLVADARAVIRAAGLRRPIVVGHSWGASVALELAARAPRSVAGVVLVDGGLLSPRDKMDWPTVKRELAPPHLAGMPLTEFRRRIPTFFDGAIEVTPQIEEIVLSVLHVDRRGRIRPRLTRANHLRILRALWLRDPDEALERLSVPALAVLSRGDEASWIERRTLVASRLRRTAPPVRITSLRGIHDLPLQHPDALAGRIERFAEQLVR
jgi:pimeloyl-ACP methyl ester carboxylesterase